MIDLKNQNVLVTGSSSMIGKAICKSLEERGAIIKECPHTQIKYEETFNLLDENNTRVLFTKTQPKYVIHAAGWNGGIEWNRRFPATIFERTVKMGMNVLSACADPKAFPYEKPEKVISILASCSYPDNQQHILLESDLWQGLPNSTVECHGLAKRVLHAYSRQINKQYGVNAICCVLTNSYGPFDSYHPDKTKVVGALIKKFVEAKINNAEEVVCWGSGTPLREFIYSEDAGEAIVQSLEKYDDNIQVMNIGSDQEITIKELTEIIAKIVGYTGRIVWDISKPDGQMRKKLSTTKMRSHLNVDIIPLEKGLRKTIKWYQENKDFADGKTISDPVKTTQKSDFGY